ncbi:MAG: hypothetical protein A2Y22_03140 [Clostridiales bacterium GWD2_32_59]|nr:MAG: hypothetical protein A2Y22_03140 [Clostridiales bacterium GWD2_32_59]
MEGRLLCVTRLVILAALATIAIPIFINKNYEAKQIAHNENVRSLQMQGQAYLLSLDSITPGVITNDLVSSGYIKEIPANPLGGNPYVVTVNANGTVTVTPRIVLVTGIPALAEVVFAEAFANEDNKGAGTTADWLNGSLGGAETEVLNAINNLGGTGNDYFNAVIKDSEGNYVAVGYSDSNLSSILGETVNGADTKGNTDFVIAKFNSSLQLIAINNLGGASGDVFESVIQDSAGNYIAVGNSLSDLSNTGEGVNGSITQGSNDFVIAKFNNSLALTAINNLGGTGFDFFMDVIQDSGGSYVAVGYSQSDLTSISGEEPCGGATMQGGCDFVIAKFNSSLALTAINNLGGTTSEYFMDVIQDSGGNYVAVGNSDSNLSSISGETVNGVDTQGDFDLVIAKFDSSLTLAAINNLGGEGREYGNGLIQDSGGNYVIVGSSSGDLSNISGETVSGANTQGSYDFLIAKFNSSLVLTAINNLGGTAGDGFDAVIQDSDGSYVAVGESSSNLSSISGEAVNGANTQGDNDFVIAKFNSSLALTAINNLGGTVGDSFNAVTQDNEGNYVVVGNSYSDLSSIPGETVSGENAQGGWHEFIISKFNDELSYIPASNTLISDEIDLGSSLTNIKIKVDATIPGGTSYVFSYSTNGTDFTVVDNASLDGETDINIGGSSSLWWKIVLTGDASSTPEITGVTVYE